MHTISERKLLFLRPCEIKIPLSLARRKFDEYELRSLIKSISSNGVLQPLSITKNSDGRYELVSGLRRLKAASLVGLRRVPCILHKADAKEALIYSLNENLQRKQLSYFEEAAGIQKLTSLYGFSIGEAAARLGIEEAELKESLKLLKISAEMQESIVMAGLAKQHAILLLNLSPEKRWEALEMIISEGMSIKQTERYIADILEPKPVIKAPEPSKPIRKSAIGDARLFTNSLSKLVETLKSSGMDAALRKYETDKYIEYRVRIKKETQENNIPAQLKIC